MWLYIALASAVTYGLENIFTKRSGVHFNTFITTWAILLIGALFYIPLLISSHIPNHLNSTFCLAVVLRLVLDSSALLIYVKSLRMAPLSLIVPMNALAPVFIAISSIFINHLFPSFFGTVSICIILLGVYFLNFDHDTKHLLSPFKAILNNKGVMLAVLAMIIWAFVTSLRRLAIDNSNVIFYTSFFQIIWAILFTPVAIIASKKDFIKIFSVKSITHLVPVGILDGLQVLTYNIALSLTLPAYASAIRTTSILFSAVFAAIFFKEKLGKHLVPIIVIVLGVALLSLTK